MEAKSVQRRELEIVKEALARILQEENPLPPDQQQARDDELSSRLGFDDSCSSSPRGLQSRDLSIISRLLHQVRLLENTDGEEISEKKIDPELDASCNGSVTNDKDVVETMVHVANAAAEAAKAAAASSGKILEITETVLSNSDTAISHQRIPLESKNRGREAHKEKASKPSSLPDKNLVKKVGRQNQITHWILGLMFVTTAIWRFKLLTMFMGVRKSVSNPFQTLGEMVSEGFKGGDNKEEQTPPKGLHKARAVLPSILGGEEREVRKMEKTERSTAVEDFNVGDALNLSLDNILNVGKPNNDSDKEESTK